MQWLWETDDILQPVALYRAYAEVLEEALERWINEDCGISHIQSIFDELDQAISRGILVRRRYLIFDGAPEPKSE